MKKVAYLSIVLILLAVLAVPAMAKSPQNNGKGNGANAGHGNGVSAGESSTGQIPANQGQGNQANHQNQQNRSNRGNNGVKDGNQGRNHPNTPFYLQGTITEIMTGTETISVTLTHGNAMVKQFIGLDLTIKATEGTQIFKITQGNEDESGEGESATGEEGDANRVAISFDQLAVGQKVAIHGNLVDGVYTARLITEYIQTPLGESTGEQP